MSGTTPELPTSFQPLKDQLLAAAEAFASEAKPLGEILTGIVDDVDRASRQELEIFPVCHHSPSSAVHIVRRLQSRCPSVIYMECCEDMQDVLEGLRDCKLPVALQAFASHAPEFPHAWAPLSLVCPLTEFSAEFQAIAYAMSSPETELVFVDRSADHVFQWLPQEDEALQQRTPTEEPDDENDAAMHGSAVGIEIGSLKPTVQQFHRYLLNNARVQHFSEWWDQYVEESIIGSDYSTYRQVMFLIGSLFRRIGISRRDLQEDELRERYMWTRIKQHLRQSQIDPSDAIYICGAAHSASRVEEFGVDTDTVWEIPPRTQTTWAYGLLPSSYRSIEYQFAHPHGVLTLAETRWRKNLRRQRLKAFSLTPEKKRKGKRNPKDKTDSASSATLRSTETRPSNTHPSTHPLLTYLQKPPEVMEEDEAELVNQCVRIVDLARRNGYLATTADAIAVYQTAILLANLRNRRHPTPYDFRDAAVTCIEKDAVPRKRDVSRLCDILLGGDKTGQIGYESLPPLAQSIYDQLSILPINLQSRTIQRALLDFRRNPEYLPCSKLLWQLRYLLAGDIVRPITGQCQLGHIPQQESWDLAIGKHQGAVIQLGYEGVTVQDVLHRRLKHAAFDADARADQALAAAEDSVLLLDSPRITDEIGRRAIELLVEEPDVKHAQEIHQRISRLIHYYRTTESGLPAWCQEFVTTGYSHYANLLPAAFSDRGTEPTDLSAMLQFILTLENLALSLGCERSELVIAINQSAAGTVDCTKQAMLWATECVLQLRDLKDLREHFDDLLGNELTLPALPKYLEGFLLAIPFAPLIIRLTVELMSKAFERLPDRILMPWVPTLIMMLRPHANTILPVLIKEACSVFPTSLDALASWQPPWDQCGEEKVLPASSQGTLSAAQAEINSLLSQYPATINALAFNLGWSVVWKSPTTETDTGSHFPAAELLRSHPSTMQALSKILKPQ